MHYDYLIVGSGLYGAMFAHLARKQGKKCLVVEKDCHIGGFCHSEIQHGIHVHKYGAHIFRTNKKSVWDFVNSICEFEPFVNTPIARYGNEIYNLPFNMNTFAKMFGVTTPQEAKERLAKSIVPCENPQNLEEFVLSVVGAEVYEKLIKHYTEKQWGKSCTELPVSTMSRIPIRFTYDNNYYREKYQGIPKDGYDAFISKLLEGSDVLLNCEYNDFMSSISPEAYGKLVYTGPIDSYFSYMFGRLEWRSVRFEHNWIPNQDNLQGVAVMNYTDDRPYTRSIEHKHFLHTDCRGTIVSYEFPCSTGENDVPSYPILTNSNIRLYKRYKEYADKHCPNVIFGGRLGRYKYYSMNEIVEEFVCK